jgi:hypothetical protein
MTKVMFNPLKWSKERRGALASNTGSRTLDIFGKNFWNCVCLSEIFSPRNLLN